MDINPLTRMLKVVGTNRKQCRVFTLASRKMDAVGQLDGNTAVWFGTQHGLPITSRRDRESSNVTQQCRFTHAGTAMAHRVLVGRSTSSWTEALLFTDGSHGEEIDRSC